MSRTREYIEAALVVLEYEQTGTHWKSKSGFITISLPPSLEWATLKVTGDEEELLFESLTAAALYRLGHDIRQHGFTPSSRLHAESVYSAHRNALRHAEIDPMKLEWNLEERP